MVGAWLTLAQWIGGLSAEVGQADATFARLRAETRRLADFRAPISDLTINEVRVTLDLVCETQSTLGRARAFFRRTFIRDDALRYRLRRQSDRRALRFECVVAPGSEDSSRREYKLAGRRP